MAEEIDTATERAARLVYLMMRGWTPTTPEVAVRCNLSYSGAWRLLSRISIEVPVFLDCDHRWRIVDEIETHRHYVVSD